MYKKVRSLLTGFSILLLLGLLTITGCTSKQPQIPESVITVPEQLSAPPAFKPEKVPILEPEPEIEVFTKTGFMEKLQKALREGTKEEALSLYNELPEEYAENFDLLYLKATLHFSLAQYDEAAEMADFLEDFDPENEDLLNLRMMLAKATGNDAEKQRVLNALLKIDPMNSDANTELGDEMMLKRNFKKANTYYLKALGGDKNNVDALLGYGQSSYYLGNLHESENAFLRLTELDPTNAFAWSYLAKLKCENENYAEAIKNIKIALELEPEFYDYWIDYGLYLNHRNLNSEALEAWTKAIELRPDYFLGYVYRGGLYDNLNRLEDALQDYLAVTRLNKEYYYAHESIAVLYWGLGDYEKSRAWFQKTQELYPSNKSYYMMIALTYYAENTKESKKTGRDYINKNVLKQFDRNSAEYAVARLFYDNLQPAQVDTKVKAMTNSNERGKWLYYLGMYYHFNGNDEMAFNYYSEVMNIQSAQFFEFRLNEWAMKGSIVE